MPAVSRSLRRLFTSLLICLAGLPVLTGADDSIASQAPLKLEIRTRVETAPGSGRHHALFDTVEWQPARTAIVVCDMWDKHWCQGATRRVAEMAPRMNAVLNTARDRGVLIIHCPSDTMDFYEGTPQRLLARSAPAVKTEIPLERWCRLDPEREGQLPVDDSDGGCDCQPQCRNYKAWSRQIESIEVKEGDAVTDSSEAYYLMRQRGIENVIVMGVHTNMCVLGRPFSIRQIVQQGMNVLLMRDLTDSMYNPRQAPYVNHFTGTDLIVEHIERHWCPTMTSVAFLGGEPFRSADDDRPHLVMVISEDEYKTEQTLPEFAKQHLGQDFRVSFVFGGEEDKNSLPGIEVLNEADVALFSVRRRVLPKPQMDVIRTFVADGKPLVGIRTASHAFALRNQEPPEGYEAWPEFDRDVLGGNYHNHHGNELRATVWVVPEAQDHPILKGVSPAEFQVYSSLYRTQPLAESTTLLMLGRVEGAEQHEPVAWTNDRKAGARVFYTSLGHEKDFALEPFQRLLTNGIRWAAGVTAPAR